MKYNIECTYCGKQWIENVYNEFSLVDKKCPVCKDRNIKARRLESSKINYYQGSPPFPLKGDTKDEWPWGYGSD